MLDVRGMKCGGCSAAVRRILLADPAVESAAVNLLTESAVVRIPPRCCSNCKALPAKRCRYAHEPGNRVTIHRGHPFIHSAQHRCG